MKDKDFRKKLDKIRGAISTITNELNLLYNDFAESSTPAAQKAVEAIYSDNPCDYCKDHDYCMNGDCSHCSFNDFKGRKLLAPKGRRLK